MAIFWPKPGVNFFGKMSFFSTCMTPFFQRLERRFFVLEYLKRHFLRLYGEKKKVGKMAIFGLKQWDNPFGKMSTFRLSGLLVFRAQKPAFSFQNIIKDIFLAYIAKKKNLDKWPVLDQNHGLTPLEKSQFFDYSELLFLQPRKAFFVLEYHKRHFPGLYCLRKKAGKMASFGPKT